MTNWMSENRDEEQKDIEVDVPLNSDISKTMPTYTLMLFIFGHLWVHNSYFRFVVRKIILQIFEYDRSQINGSK